LKKKSSYRFTLFYFLRIEKSGRTPKGFERRVGEGGYEKGKGTKGGRK